MVNKVGIISHRAKDPEGFQRLQVFDSILPYSESDKFLLNKRIQEWDSNTKLKYKKEGIPEAYLFGAFTWTVSDKLIKALEEKIGEEKLYKEVEFMHIKIVPEDGEGKIYNNYYMMHVLNEIDTSTVYTVDENKDLTWHGYKKEVIQDKSFFRYDGDYEVKFTDKVIEVIKGFNIQVIDYIEEENTI